MREPPKTAVRAPWPVARPLLLGRRGRISSPVRIASVLLPMPLPEAFDYAEPEGMELSVGDIVAAPLGPRLVRGVVTALSKGRGRVLAKLAAKKAAGE